MNEYLLYGLAKGEGQQYMESLLLNTTDEKNIERVKVLASKDGYHTFRVATYNGEKPNFIGAIN